MESKKTDRADLEKIKGTLLIGGIVFAAALVLVAMEYKVYEQKKSDLGELKVDMIEEEVIPRSRQQPPPPPPPPKPTTVIDIVEDEEEIEEELVIEDMEVDEDTEIQQIEQVEEDVEEEKIFKIVEDMPQFPGGQQALMKYLAENIKYPAIARDAGIQGTVFVTFVVDENGNVGEVEVLRGIGGGADEEAKRVVRSMPKWKPGKQRGKPVKVQYNLPVRFTLK